MSSAQHRLDEARHRSVSEIGRCPLLHVPLFNTIPTSLIDLPIVLCFAATISLFTAVGRSIILQGL